MSERSERIVGRRAVVASCRDGAERSAGMSERSERIVGRRAVVPHGGTERSGVPA
jgi:hypothetical protein